MPMMERDKTKQVCCKYCNILASVPPVRRNISCATKVGCDMTPTARSVPAKLANSMLYVVCSLRRVFIAIITNTFITTMKGSVTRFRVTEMREKTTYSSLKIRQGETEMLVDAKEAFVKFMVTSVVTWLRGYGGDSRCGLDLPASLTWISFAKESLLFL